MEKHTKKFLVFGCRGMAGSAVCRALSARGIEHRGLDRSDGDFLNPMVMRDLIEGYGPDVIVMAAAKVGGIVANMTNQTTFLAENLKLQLSLFDAVSHLNECSVIFLGSVCIYPDNISGSIDENQLLAGHLQKTNEGYAIAKIAGIKLSEYMNQELGTDIRCLMPTNLYGPSDNFNLLNSHVVPALIREAIEAKHSRSSYMEVWRSGRPTRDFMHVDDLADAIVFISQIVKSDWDTFLATYNLNHINIGTGVETSIKKLAQLICNEVGFSGALRFDEAGPDGCMERVLDCSRATILGWDSRIELRKGIASVVHGFHLERRL